MPILDGTAANLPFVMLALATFGIGQGLFISPNSSAIMATAPAELTGEAGSLLNVVRYLGISAGIAGASALLALRLAATAARGRHHRSRCAGARRRQPRRGHIALRLRRPGRRAIADANRTPRSPRCAAPLRPEPLIWRHYPGSLS